jgi:hypothetical protein
MPAPNRVYLDQNKWIDLSKCRLGREDGDRFRDVLDVLRHGVEHGLVSCPRSAQHYMETARRNNATSRHDVAVTMAELSNFHTIAPAKVVVPMELDCALRDRFGRPQTPRAVPIFGTGFRHAFAWEQRLVEVPDDLQLDVPTTEAFERWVNEDLLEFAALAGPVSGTYIAPDLSHQMTAVDDAFVAFEKRLAAGLRQEPDRREALVRYAAASELVTLVPQLNEALERAGLSVGETRSLESPEGMTDLLMAIPSRSVVHDLRARQHANSQTVWKSNDLKDLSALGIAIASCDIVVTERHWAHVARAEGTDSRFRTIVISDLTELIALRSSA